MTTFRLAPLFLALLGLALGACVEEPPAPAELERRTGEIRPTDGDGWQGNGYDPAVEVFSADSEGGHFRVWYTLDGGDAVPDDDVDPENGIPDFVDMVATHADTTWDVLIDELGFRRTLDDSRYHDRPDYGGDGRFDIYLVNISENDGYRVVEVCLERPFHCAGYLVIENDFVGFNYPNLDIAIKTLVSHEFAHGVLDAYDADVPRFLSEGFATWAEEAVFPEQDDFERFIEVYFAQTDRPIDLEQPGNQRDIFPYSTAIWPKFIEERYGVDMLKTILEGLDDTIRDDPQIWDVTDATLRADADGDLGEAFTEFALWNGLTGPRAGLLEGRGYADAARYGEVDLGSLSLEAEGGGFTLDRTVELDRLAASYFAVDVSDAAGRSAQVEAVGRLRFVVLAHASGVASEPVVLRPAGALDRGEINLPQGGELLVVAVNASPDRIAQEGTFSLEIAPHAANNGATNNGATNNGATNNGATNNGADNNAKPDPFTDDEGGDSGGDGGGCGIVVPTSGRPVLPLLPLIIIPLLRLSRRSRHRE